jgi:hypothetical protein
MVYPGDVATADLLCGELRVADDRDAEPDVSR